MEVGAETVVFPEVEQRRRNILSLEGRKADARHGSVFEKSFEQAAGTLLPLSGVASVVAELSASQDDFLDALCLAGAHLRHDAVDGNASLAAARVRDDAESA